MSDDARMASDDLGDLEVVSTAHLLGPELRLNPTPTSIGCELGSGALERQVQGVGGHEV